MTMDKYVNNNSNDRIRVSGKLAINKKSETKLLVSFGVLSKQILCC
jgi:hypothetical protein